MGGLSIAGHLRRRGRDNAAPQRCWACRRAVPLAVVAEADGAMWAGLCLRCILVDGALPALVQALPVTGGVVVRQRPGYYLDALAQLLGEADGTAGNDGVHGGVLRCAGPPGARTCRWLSSPAAGD